MNLGKLVQRSAGLASAAMAVTFLAGLTPSSAAPRADEAQPLTSMAPEGAPLYDVTAAPSVERSAPKVTVRGRIKLDTCGVTMPAAVSPDGTYAFIGAYASRYICVIDMKRAKIVKKIKLDAANDYADEFTFSPDGRTLYAVVNRPDKKYGYFSRIVTIDVQRLKITQQSTQRFLWTTPVFNLKQPFQANGLAATDDLIYTTTNAHVVRYDPKLNKIIDWKYRAADSPVDLAINADASRIWTFGDTGLLIDLPQDNVVSTRGALAPRDPAMSPDLSRLYVTDWESFSTVYILNPDTMRTLRKFRLPDPLWGITVSPDNKYVWVGQETASRPRPITPVPPSDIPTKVLIFDRGGRKVGSWTTSTYSTLSSPTFDASGRRAIMEANYMFNGQYLLVLDVS